MLFKKQLIFKFKKYYNIIVFIHTKHEKIVRVGPIL